VKLDQEVQINQDQRTSKNEQDPGISSQRDEKVCEDENELRAPCKSTTTNNHLYGKTRRFAVLFYNYDVRDD